MWEAKSESLKSENLHVPWADVLTEISRGSRISRKYCNSDVDICICGYALCMFTPFHRIILAQTAELKTITE